MHAYFNLTKLFLKYKNIKAAINHNLLFKKKSNKMIYFIFSVVYDDYIKANGLLEDEDFMKYHIVEPFLTMFSKL
jgi:hypothetical protein